MEDLAQIRDSYIADGLNYEQAQARTAQDAMLDLIAKSELARAKNNWLHVSPYKVVSSIIAVFSQVSQLVFS